MTIKGIYKLAKHPHVFVKDYVKKRFTKEELKEYVSKAIDLDIPSHKYYYFIYKELKKEGYFSRAEQALRKAIYIKPKAEYYYALAVLLKTKWQWWQIVEALEKAIDIAEPKVKKEWYFFYVLALEKMNSLEEASKILYKLDKLGYLTSDRYFQHGNILQSLNKSSEASKMFKKAIESNPKKDDIQFGIGKFYEAKGNWILANKFYGELIQQNSDVNIKLLYRHALSFDRTYNWEEARISYLNTISLQAYNSSWYYRLGFVQERSRDWEGAVKSYSYATFRSKKNDYWYYRLGYVLSKVGKYKEACEVFMLVKDVKLHPNEEESDKSSLEEIVYESASDNIELLNKRLEENTTDTPCWYALGYQSSLLEYWEIAEYAYKEYLARKENFDSNLYFLLGNVLAQQKKYKEASKVFLEQRITQYAHGTPTTKYDKDQVFKKRVNYTEYYETFDIENNMILYESYHGSSISCNPYAIFKSLLTDEAFNNNRHVWVLNDKSKIPNELKDNVNIVFITRDCDLYMRYLAKAKYLVNNVSFPEYFIRKEEQVYLNTWHGTPIKGLGKDIKDEFMAHKNVTRNFLQASHLIQPNKYTSDILLDRYDVKDVFGGIVAQTGYPRQDLMLNITEEQKTKLLKKLNISNKKKIVLYAPTWRGLHGTAVFDTTRLEEDIKSIIELEDIHFLFRGHHMIEGLVSNLNIGNVLVPNDIDTNSLLSVVDVLITDYSSIAFDYMAMEKPIIYYTYDREEYEAERGLYLPLEDLGGVICQNSEELLESLSTTIKSNEITIKQKEAQKEFCLYDDGKATQRVIDLVFKNKKENIDIVNKTNKKSILFYGGPFLPNGIISSFINLLNHIDYDKYAVTVVVEPNKIKQYPNRLEQVGKLDKRIRILGRVGGMINRLEEDWIIDKFDVQSRLANNEMWEIYTKAHKRDMRRLLGYNSFDYFVNFEGYNTFWVSLFASFNNENNSIFLHNDIHAEWKLKFPYLEKNIKLYDFYKNVVSVSEINMNVNIEKLFNAFGVQKDKFIYCDNVQNPEDVLVKSEEEIEEQDKDIFSNDIVFINIARHSPEKDLEKLIRAFQKVVKKYPKVKLINLGSGPLEEVLKSLIRQLGLTRSILLLGQRFNPYPYLKKSDCFILSSNHEGQPITLFESLILNKPIIATDIESNRNVLENRSGVLVENSIDGLEQAMIRFIEEGQNVNNFDYFQYNEKTLNMFYEKILGD